jgi:DNA-binding XRE family transcriptional regulator
MRSMDATSDAPERRKRATAVPAVCLRVDLFEELTAKKRATTDPDRARLLGLNVFTIRRMRERGYEPSVGTALHIARVLNTKVERLWQPADDMCERVA